MKKNQCVPNRNLEAIPARAGVALKPQHYQAILKENPDIGFFEVHAENYMGAGGPPHRYLTAIREQYPLSVHGVGLSLGGENPIDKHHLARLRQVVNRYQPQLVSEHLAWSSHDGKFLNDLLPVAYTRSSLDRLVAHLDQTQEALGRRILLENPATYLRFRQSEMQETEFLANAARRSGCLLLLDINNVYVSAVNHAYSAEKYIDEFPLSQVAQIHIAGHATEIDAEGQPLLIDSHDHEIASSVWRLYEHCLAQTGPLPTLLERDGNIPEWPVLFAEAQIAEMLLDRCAGHQDYANAGNA